MLFQWKEDYYVEEQSWLCKLCSSLDSSTNQYVFPPSQVKHFRYCSHDTPRKIDWGLYKK